MSLVSFITTSTCIHQLYPVVDSILTKRSAMFSASNRKRYIVKNVIKSIMLCCLVIFSLIFVFTEDWTSPYIKHVASMYVANDFVALITCRTLSWSTKIHHTVSCIFLMYASIIDFSQSLEAQMLFYYTFFSACTFFVNLYLGLRLCYKDLPTLRLVCKYGYLYSLVINWALQLFLGWGKVQYWYMALLLFIINDDIVLLRWLWR